MDLFNRWLVTLLAIAAAAASCFVVAAIAGWVAPSALPPAFPVLGSWVSALQENADPITLASAVGVAVVAFGLIGIEWLVPAGRRRVVIQRDELGSVTVSLPGLRRLANHVIGEVAGVETVVSEALPTRDGVAFNCRIVVKPDANTPELAQVVRERLETAIRSHTGRPVTRVHVHTQVGRGELRKRVR